VDVPQVREAAEPFVSKLFPRGTKLLRTEPLRAMVIGAFVRGLSMRDVESLCEQAGLGKLSKSTASRICQELRERFEQFGRRDLYDTREAVEDLARREAACCPFLDYRVETVGDEAIYTITNPIGGDQRASVDAMLDAIHDLPDHAGSDMAGLLGRLAERDVHAIDAGGERFEVRDSAAG
jgi:mutator family transposase